MKRQQKVAADIDPFFLKAYGVQYNKDRNQEIILSAVKQQELDQEYIDYMEDRMPTPESEKTRRKEEVGESSSNDESEDSNAKKR